MEIKIIIAAFNNVWVYDICFRVFFVDMNETDVSEIASALDDWSFIDYFL